MAELPKIVLVASDASHSQGMASDLRAAAYDVVPLSAPVEPVGPTPDGAPADVAGELLPDLVLIDASSRDDVPAAVHACRLRWPEQTLPVLVLGSVDASVSVAAIEAGATDSVPDSLGGPMLTAHVRRMLRSAAALRGLLHDERRRAQRESLTHAAADLARPLGEMIDELESIMAKAPVDERLDELLELTGRAVDAVDRLRRLASSAETTPS